MIPPEHVSHDHLNEQKDIPIDNAVFQRWRAHFERLEQESREKGEELKWVMVDGFLLYWHPVSQITVVRTKHLTGNGDRTSWTNWTTAYSCGCRTTCSSKGGTKDTDTTPQVGPRSAAVSARPELGVLTLFLSLRPCTTPHSMSAFSPPAETRAVINRPPHRRSSIRSRGQSMARSAQLLGADRVAGVC